MSASEKLKALLEQGSISEERSASWSVMDALPQIVAVVEAAEDANAWIEEETSGFGQGGILHHHLYDALSSLKEALT